MKRFIPAFAVVLVAGLTILSGLIHGRVSNRWGPRDDLLAIGKKLEEFTRDSASERFGSWRLRTSERMGDTEVNILQCVGHCVLTYENQETGETVTVTLLAGPPGPLLVHPPEVCYGGAGYQPLKQRERITVRDSEGSDHDLWIVRLQAGDLTERTLDVGYAWNAAGHWVAPVPGPPLAVWKHPRVLLSRHPYLYKIQVASPAPSDTEAEMDVVSRFLRDFAPVVTRCLSPPSGD